MNSLGQMRNYNVIFRNFLNYLPSRFFVILNSFIIIPMFAYFLTTSEMSIFQISIGVLNLVCTCSTDWIAKSVLRFYEKYRLNDNHNAFFTNIAMLMLACYFLIFLFYAGFHDIIFEKFFIEPKIFLLSLILVVPFGIRQLLYQLLRILKMPLLYTISIIVYQIFLVILFLSFSKMFGNVVSILTAMAFSGILIDFIILKKVSFKLVLNWGINFSILKEVLIYAIPLVLTNSSIWLVLHFNKFVLQFSQEFVNTAIAGLSWLFVSNILTPLFSTLLFAVFPVIIKRFESTYRIKPFITAVLQIYAVMFIPFVSVFCFFSKDIASIAFSSEYSAIAVIMPFSALTLFLHEFMKLLNIKYHLQNKTYIETVVSLAAAVVCVVLNLVLIKYYGLIGVGAAMLISMGLLVLLNSFIKFKSFEYLNRKAFLLSAFSASLISFLSYGISALIFYGQTNIFCIIAKIIVFIAIYSVLVFALKKRIFVLH